MRTRCTRSSWRNAEPRVRFYRERSLPLRVPKESTPTIPVAAVTKLRETSFSLSSPSFSDSCFCFPARICFTRIKRGNRAIGPRVSNNGTRPNFFSSRAFLTLHPSLISCLKSNLLLSPFVVVIARKSLNLEKQIKLSPSVALRM